jgi:hypothetical protein
VADYVQLPDFQVSPYLMPYDFFLWASSDVEEDKVGVFQQGYSNTVHDALNIMFLWHWTGR